MIWNLLSNRRKRRVTQTRVQRVRRPISVVSRIEGAKRCSVCMGVIKRELPKIDCLCGSSFHQSCAVRIGICPICSSEIHIPQTISSVVDPSTGPVRSMPLSGEDRLFLLVDRFLMGEIDQETYDHLREEIIEQSPEPDLCERCGMRLYPGEECRCTQIEPINCPECGRELEMNSGFCRSCGLVLSEDFPEKLYQCSACGRIVLSSERKCTCGAVLLDPGESICPECGLPVPPGSMTCPNCERVIFIELLECPICGCEVSPTAFECECGAIFQDRIERIECPDCKEEIKMDDKFCRSCGVQFSENGFSSRHGLY